MSNRFASSALFCVVGLCFALAGCSGQPASTVQAADDSSASDPVCLDASESTTTAVNDLVVAKGQGNTVIGAATLFDEGTGFWLISAEIDPALNGDSYIGIWASPDDASDAQFNGELFSLAGNVSETQSLAPVTDEVTFNRQEAPVVGCYSQLRLDSWGNPR